MKRFPKSSLLARGVLRGTLLATSLLLFPLWGDEVFGRYAALAGAWTFLLPVAGWGLDKAALKLVPRLRRAQTGAVLALVSAGLVLAFGSAIAAGSLAWNLGSPENRALHGSLIAVNVLWAFAFGLQAAFRALGLDRVDACVSLALALMAGLALGATWAFDLGPAGYTSLLASGLLLVTLLQTRRLLDRVRGAGRYRRRLIGPVMHQASFLGLNTVLGTGALSAAFLIFHLRGLHAEAAYFSIGYNLCLLLYAFSQYVLRLLIPSLSQGIKQWSLAEFSTFSRQLLQSISALTAGTSLVVSGVYLLTKDGLAEIWRGAPITLLCAGLAGVFVATEIALSLFELKNAKSLRSSCVASACGLTLVLAVGFFAIPALGAEGAVIGLAAGELSIQLCLLIRQTVPAGAA